MSAPNTPTLTVVNDGTGTSVTATVGSDAGAINQLFYKAQTDTVWTAGETIIGPGQSSRPASTRTCFISSRS